MPRLGSETGDTIPITVKETLSSLSNTRAEIIDLAFLTDIGTK
jgi:hypothetical protein